MSWDNITGDSKIIPGGGNSNEIIFETDKPKRFRLLIPEGQQPYSYLEHCFEMEKIENGQVVKIFRTIRCPQTTKNPHAHCPLCDGQQVRRRSRHAANAYDYDSNSVMKLNAGDAVFKPIATLRKMGIDVTTVDWAVLKSGEGRNDTEYTCTNMGQTPFVLPAGSQLYDLETEYAPATIDEMKDIIEGAGGNWDSLIVPPQLKYPTLQEALDHIMPNGKYKDQKFSDLWDKDKTNRGMIYFLGMKSDRVSDEKAAAQVILANLGGIQIPGVPVGGVAPAQNIPSQSQVPMSNIPQGIQMQTPVQQPAPTQQAQPAPTQPAPSAEREAKINKLNGYFTTKKKFTDGGFATIIQAMKDASEGKKTNIVDFTDAELDKLMVICEQAQ